MNNTLETAYEISMNLKQYTSALKIALKLDKIDFISRVFD